MQHNLETLPDPEVALDQLAELQERAKELDVQARQFIRKNPVLTLVGAVTVGFLIGKMVTR